MASERHKPPRATKNLLTKLQEEHEKYKLAFINKYKTDLAIAAKEEREAAPELLIQAEEELLLLAREGYKELKLIYLIVSRPNLRSTINDIVIPAKYKKVFDNNSKACQWAKNRFVMKSLRDSGIVITDTMKDTFSGTYDFILINEQRSKIKRLIT